MQALEEHVRHLQSQVNRLEIQDGPQKLHKAYKATPTELPDGDSRQYAIHARNRLSDPSVWCDDDHSLQSSGPPPLTFCVDSDDEASEYNESGQGVHYHSAQ